MTNIESQVRAEHLATLPLQATGPGSGFGDGMVGQFRDIWAHRELLDLLIRRELKARYKDSTLGFFWSLIRPLTLLLIYYVAIGKFLGAATVHPRLRDLHLHRPDRLGPVQRDRHAPAPRSIVGNGGLIKKVYLPREIFPLSALGSALFNFVIQLVILIARDRRRAASSPTGARLAATCRSSLRGPAGRVGLALALLLSAVNVYLRDVQYLVEIALMIAVLGLADRLLLAAGRATRSAATLLERLYLANPMTLGGPRVPAGVLGRGRRASPYPPNLGVSALASRSRSASSSSGSRSASSRACRATSRRSCDERPRPSSRSRDVSKRFVIRKEKSLKERLVNFGRSNLHKEDFWALRDVDLEIESGHDRRARSGRTARARARCSS